MFNPEKMAPFVTTNRAGNTDLEFNMNSHVRKFNQIFIVQTEPNGAASAKQLNFNPGEEDEDDNPNFPPIVFTNPQRGYAKDCWLIELEDKDEGGMKAVQTICKSSTDEYLNADCLVPTGVTEVEGKAVKTLQFSTKIKAQEIDVNYPCLVSNIGLSRIMIQSLTCPDQVASFSLEKQNMEFMCFADYQSMNDIGFKDNRDQIQ